MKNFLFSIFLVYLFFLIVIPVSILEASGLLPITLEETIKRVLENNISISVQNYDSQVKEQFIFDKEADFDPTLDLTFTVGEETRLRATTLANAKTRNQDYNWNFSVSQKFINGADYDLSIDSNRNMTNSIFASFNPVYTTDLTLNITQPLLKDFGIDLNKREISIAKNDQSISDHQFTKKVIDILTEAENIYWDLVFSIEDL